LPKLPITILIAARNEAANIARCLQSLHRAERVVVLDSQSTDDTASIAQRLGADIVQFSYTGGYPKKRQWALDTLTFPSPWILLLDADEVVPDELWREIETALSDGDLPAAFLIKKEFHFLGRRFRHGGFSHAAVLLFRHGHARFEHLLDEIGSGLDMEVHERVIVEGRVGRLRTPLIHEDFKGLEAYRERHHRYATWEAALRHHFLATGTYGKETIQPRLFGNTQERRRFLKKVVIRLPFEPAVWFAYHYLLRGGFLEGRPGFIACRIRAQYIAEVRTKLRVLQRGNPEVAKPSVAANRKRLKWFAGLLALCVLSVLAGVLFDDELLCVRSRLQPGDAIVVLGGEPVIRVAAAAALATNGFAARVIVSGAGDCEDNRRLLEKLGVAPRNIEVECDSGTTEENARFTVARLRKHGCRRVIIVTSWFHSRRALSCFRHYAPEMEFISAPVARAKPFRDERHYIGAEYLKTVWYVMRFGIVPSLSP